MFVFTPPYSRLGYGTVTIGQRPDEAVSPATYRAMLGRRIQEMIADTDPDEAKPLLRQLAMQEGLILTVDMTRAGETIAEFSQTLRELAAYPMAPISPDAFNADDETASAICDETFEEWVMGLLRD